MIDRNTGLYGRGRANGGLGVCTHTCRQNPRGIRRSPFFGVSPSWRHMILSSIMTWILATAARWKKLDILEKCSLTGLVVMIRLSFSSWISQYRQTFPSGANVFPSKYEISSSPQIVVLGFLDIQGVWGYRTSIWIQPFGRLDILIIPEGLF